MSIRGKRFSPPLSEMWRRSRPGLAAVVIFGIFINLLRFSGPLYLIQIFDRVVSSRSIETLVALTAAALLALVASAALETVRRRMLSRWSVWIEHQLTTQSVRAGLTAGVANAPVLANIEKVSSFVERELVHLLCQAPEWQRLGLRTGSVHLATNRISFELARAGDSKTVCVELEYWSGWLVAEVTRPGRLSGYTPRPPNTGHRAAGWYSRMSRE